jgi:acetolactate synthase regulatory subunit
LLKQTKDSSKDSMAKVKCSLQIECNHTAETIDRIMLPIRKRGLKASSFNYEQSNENSAICTLSFEIEETDIERVYRNLIRQTDINKVQKI